MNASSSLPAIPPPAVPAGESAPSGMDQSAAMLAATDSFFSFMSQAGIGAFSNPNNSESTMAAEPFPADSSDKAASSTLLAVMVQLPAGPGQSSPPTVAPAQSSAPNSAEAPPADGNPATTGNPSGNESANSPAAPGLVKSKILSPARTDKAEDATKAPDPAATPADPALLAMLVQPHAAAMEPSNVKNAPAAKGRFSLSTAKPAGLDAPVTVRPSPEHKPEIAGPLPKIMEPGSAKAAAPIQGQPAQPAEPAEPALKPPTAATPTTPANGLNSADGTGGALSSQRMNFAVEKNEIAGPDAQKVPGSSPKEAFAVQAAGDSAGASDSGHSGHNQDAADSNFVMDWPAKAGELNLDAGTGAVAASSANHAAMQAERIGHMVSQQVVLIRQSGAGNLGVTLRLDPQTELNLQLTNHNGRIEASVRVERGAVAGLDGHWKDLQDSLARQNVQLFPLEGKAAARTSVFGSASDSANTTSFRQPSQNPQGQSREAPQGWPLAGAVQSVPPTEKATTRTVSRQGWESWA